MTRRRLPAATPSFDVAAAVDLLRQLIARTDALVQATEHQLERLAWSCERDDDDDARGLEHLSHLLGAATESAKTTVIAGNELAAELANHQGAA